MARRGHATESPSAAGRAAGRGAPHTRLADSPLRTDSVLRPVGIFENHGGVYTMTGVLSFTLNGPIC
jgi:hypothetical protein